MPLLVAALVVVALAALGWIAWLNGDVVTLRLGPATTMQVPMGWALAGAVAAGAAAVGLVALLGALRRGWRRLQAHRRARKATKHAEQTARAQHLAWSGASEQARATILRSERGAPTEPERIELVAQTYLSEGDLAGAAALLEGALERHPGDLHLLDLLATVAERRGDLPRAIELVRRARRHDPTSPRLAVRERDLSIRTGRWRHALAVHDELVATLKTPEALAQEQDTGRGLRFEVARADGEPERSAKLLASLAREHPDFLPAWVEAGDRFLAAGKPAKARKVWERGARTRPAAPLLDRLEAIDASEGASARTTALYRVLLGLHPDLPVLRWRLVRHLLALGDVDAAMAELDSLDASAPPATILLGEALRRRGDHERAATMLSRGLGPALGLPRGFRCRACDAGSRTWTAACPRCHRWGTLDSPDESGELHSHR